jgi:hypothetical protein
MGFKHFGCQKLTAQQNKVPHFPAPVNGYVPKAN